jgi:hypothetical protein
MRRAFAIALTAAALLTKSHLASASTNLGPFFDPAGEVRTAVVTASDPINTTASFSTGFVPIPGLSIPITIPHGKVADVKILFSGEMNSGDAEYVTAVVDGFQTSPGIVQAGWNFGGGATSQGANFATVIGEGNHTIEMQWGGLGHQQFMSMRSMTVIVNVRRAARAG